MSTYRFTEVRERATKVLPCPRCGRSVRRSTTVTHTINPFNKDADGIVKDYAKVRADVSAEVAAWKAAPAICGACADPS